MPITPQPMRAPALPEGWLTRSSRPAWTMIERPMIECGLAAYFAVAFVLAAHGGHYVSLPFLTLFLFGFGYVGVLSLHQSR